MKKKNVLGELLITPFKEWSQDNAAVHAAALAYYTVISLVPLLLIILITASMFIKSDTVIDQISVQAARFTSPQVANFIRSILGNQANTTKASSASIISILVLAAGASGIFSQLQSSLNKICDVPPKGKSALRKAIVDHFLSFLMVIGLGLLFLLFLLLNAVVSILISHITTIGQNKLTAAIINYLILFVILSVLFAMIFRIIPDKQITWGDVWLGAVVNAVLFMVGRYAIGIYLSYNQAASGYGAAGSLIVLLLWIYYSAQIFFFGAEFTQVYARTVGSHKDKVVEETEERAEEKAEPPASTG